LGMPTGQVGAEDHRTNTCSRWPTSSSPWC
jgi:hypothetical protein